MYQSMQGLTKGLRFTTEICSEFPGGWLPTLDFKIRVSPSNITEYCFYEKPTSSEKVLQARTALNQNYLIRSLSNEVVRILENISFGVSKQEKMAALNNFASKLVNSGHTLKSIRSILINGIRGHLRKVERCRKSGSPFHRSAAQSAPLRRTKKLLAKTK